VLEAALRRDAARGASVVGLAVSGGADSAVLLTRAARVWRRGLPRLVVFHVDHGVRGAEGAADAAYVARLAATASLPFHALRIDAAPPARNREPRRATEGRLREARYRLLARAIADFGAGALYTAHHRDDQVETLVLAALRGAGLRGLSAMPRRRRYGAPAHPFVQLVRPLLRVDRATLASIATAERLEPRFDPTNRDTRHRRNHVRHVVLPRLRRELGAPLDDHLLRLARLARIAAWRAGRGRGERSDVIHATLRRATESSPTRRVVLALVAQLDAGDERPVALGRDVFAIPRAAGVEVVRGIARDVPGFVVRVSRHAGRAPRLLAALAALDPAARRARLDARGTAYLDPARLDFAEAGSALAVRTRRPGDRYRPLRAAHEIRLKRLLIDRKIDVAARASLPVLTDAQGIVAVAGLPPADRGALTTASRDVLRVTFRHGPTPGRTARIDRPFLA
jgi:tRNA(Ile)-lysidine synthase